jgi:hypothetical protein
MVGMKGQMVNLLQPWYFTFWFFTPQMHNAWRQPFHFHVTNEMKGFIALWFLGSCNFFSLLENCHNSWNEELGCEP